VTWQINDFRPTASCYLGTLCYWSQWTARKIWFVVCTTTPYTN